MARFNLLEDMDTKLRSKGLMLILSSPSGGGKTSLAKELLLTDENTILSVSATTRPIRNGEIEGRDYFFKSKEEFEQMLQDNQFLEWASIYGNLYGTPRGNIEQLLNTGKDLIFDVDNQGARTLKKLMPEYATSIFILPPSFKEQQKRLMTRNQSNLEEINIRLSFAEEEIRYSKEYDYVIINDNFELALRELKAILQAERANKKRLDLLEVFLQNYQ